MLHHFNISINSLKFESKSDGFINHYRNEHSVWNYMCYIYKLENKNESEYNGIESYVRKKVFEIFSLANLFIVR